jgi:hypothetical protein
VIIGLWNSAAFSLDIMGPPAAELEQGWFRGGIEYSNSKIDIELNNGIWTEYLDGLFYDQGEALDLTIKDYRINRTYAGLGYGFSDNFEAFLRIGGQNARFNDSIWEDSENFDSSAEFAFGGGFKVTLYEEDNLKLGGLFQANMTSLDGQLSASHWSASDFVEVDMAEVQIALGASCKCNEHLSVYGGPFLHFISGDIKDHFSQVDSGSGGLLTSIYAWDIEEDSVFGGYFGVQMEFAENCSLNLEYQHTSGARAFGIGMLWKF